MNTTKLLICTLVGFVFLFIIEYLWFGMLGNGGGDPDMMPIWHWMILGYLLLSFVFCYMYPKGVEAGTATQQGLKYGILIALLVMVSQGFMWLAMPDMVNFEITLGSFLKNSAFHIVEMGILGVIVAHLSGAHNVLAQPQPVRGDIGGSKGGRDTPPPPPSGTTSGGN